MVNDGYKQTEIGVVPKDWSIVDFEEISSMNGRIGWQGLNQEEFTFKYNEPFLITGMNFKDGKIRWDEVYHVSEERYKQAKQIQLKKDDVLMTKDGTIGKLLYVDNIPFPRKASLNSHLLVFRPKKNAYYPRFMFYQLHSKHFLQHIELTKSGSTFFGITQEAMGRYKAILPKTEEQKAIAKALSDTDELINSLEKLIAKKEAIKQGTMQQLLTGKKRLSGFSGEWEEKKLGEIAIFRRGSFPQPYGLSKWYDESNGLPFIQVYDVDKNMKLKSDTKQHISEIAKSLSVFVKKGTVILTIQGSIGRIAITQYDAYIDRTLLIFTNFLIQMDKVFFSYVVQELFRIEKEKAAGGTIKTITKEELSGFSVMLPIFSEQQNISKTLSAMDNEIEFLKSKLSKIKAIKDGMMNELLTGKTRLLAGEKHEYP